MEAREARTEHDDRETVRHLISETLALGERRVAGSRTEREAQELMAQRFAELGLEPELQPFRYNRSLYAALVLHFAVGTLGSIAFFFSPLAALALHLLAGLSYLLDSTKRAQILRRLLRPVVSQNLIAATRKSAPRLRLVLMAHADAAYTGWMFHPGVIRMGTNGHLPRPLQFLKKSLLVATLSLFLLAAVDGIALLAPTWIPIFSILVALLSIPTLIGLVLNGQIVLKNRVVPGANDNLSSCAGLVVLARRLQAWLPESVEVVYVVTGAEEAGTGGSLALARRMAGCWNPSDTVVVGIEILSGGELRSFSEGEVVPVAIAPWLKEMVSATAANDSRFGSVAPFEIPSGMTDAAPFLYRGYDGVSFGRLDSDLGASPHYHMPSDSLENLDFDQVMTSIDFVEAFVKRVIEKRMAN